MFKQLSRLTTVAAGASLMAFATVAFVSGSLSMPATAYAHHCKGGHANDPGCEPGGGGDGGGELALSVTFRCSNVGIDRACLGPSDPDRIQGDGNGAFEHGSDKVTAKLTKFGRFLLNTGGNKKSGSTRMVYLDYTEGNGNSVPLTAGNVTTTDALGFPYKTVIHLNRRNDIADLRDITVGQTVFLDMWADILISDGGDVSQVSARFDAQKVNNCPSAASTPQDVPVFRDSETRWTVTVVSGALACVTVSDSEDSSNSGYKGDYSLGPLEMELNALP